jgi:hypothetical protein
VTMAATAGLGAYYWRLQRRRRGEVAVPGSARRAESEDWVPTAGQV